MMDALTYEKMIKDINENIEIHGLYNDKIAILITRPNLETGKQILENLEYYHLNQAIYLWRMHYSYQEFLLIAYTLVLNYLYQTQNLHFGSH